MSRSIKVDKQTSGTSCWAAVMAGILGEGYNQAGLVQTYAHLAVQNGPRAGQMNVTDALSLAELGPAKRALLNLNSGIVASAFKLIVPG